MNLNLLIPLLAQRSNWVRLGERFSGEHLEFRVEDMLGGAALVLGLLLLYLVLANAEKWAEKLAATTTPKGLLAELSAAHGLNFRERRLCRRVARELSLGEVAEVFVRPEAWHALRRYDATLANRLAATPEDQGEKR